ncbi:peptidyl-prolyl cis-trans isomerase [Burkholderia seminalis]|uniref:peptidylprolyl isomerase n=1 Tax=Burkholderia seminalis TaxID=488731 RepID=UPI001CF4432A|nr:peptidylprolyl isomerase [Burkholderia seminalis]MCA7955791.1 peptidyl-prolyl cis-trans isomerase [Burkholderia seminalis]
MRAKTWFEKWMVAGAVMVGGISVTSVGFSQEAAKSEALPAGAAAVVNGVTVTSSDIDQALKATRQPDNPQTRRQMLQALVALEILHQEAERKHYGERDEVKKVVFEARKNAEVQLYLSESIHTAPVAESQVKSRYEQLAAEAGKDEYQLAMVVLDDLESASKAMQQLTAGETFDAVARQYGAAKDGTAGQPLAWVSFKSPAVQGHTGWLPLPVAQALEHLSVGNITPQPIKTGEGYTIVKLVSKRPTQMASFDQVKMQLQSEMQVEAMRKAIAQHVAELVKSATIQE